MLFYTESPLQFAFSKLGDDGESADDTKKFGFIGIPFDSTSTYKPGSRFGPRAVREASYNFERYNVILDKNLDVSLFDFGDIEVIQGNFEKTSSIIEFTVKEILDKGIIPVAVGGEHTVSSGILKALDVENTTIVHFDAHMDLRDEYMGE